MNNISPAVYLLQDSFLLDSSSGLLEEMRVINFLLICARILSKCLKAGWTLEEKTTEKLSPREVQRQMRKNKYRNLSDSQTQATPLLSVSFFCANYMYVSRCVKAERGDFRFQERSRMHLMKSPITAHCNYSISSFTDSLTAQLRWKFLHSTWY